MVLSGPLNACQYRDMPPSLLRPILVLVHAFWLLLFVVHNDVAQWLYNESLVPRAVSASLNACHCRDMPPSLLWPILVLVHDFWLLLFVLHNDVAQKRST